MRQAGENIGAIRNDINRLREALVWRCVDLMRALDERDVANWPEIVGTAILAGLREDDLCPLFECRPDTLADWLSGRSYPFPFTRTNLKQVLLERLVALADERGSEA